MRNLDTGSLSAIDADLISCEASPAGRLQQALCYRLEHVIMCMQMPLLMPALS